MLNILIVDDEPKIRNGLKNLIRKLNENWNVIGTAEDGLCAIEILKVKQPDVLLLDIRMPNMDGLSLLEKISSENKDIIIVIVSGHAEFEYAQSAMRYGVLDYILKPISPQKVKAVLVKSEKIISARNELKTKNVHVENSIGELREKFLHDIIFETVYISEDAAKEKSDLLNLSLGRFSVGTMVIGLKDAEVQNIGDIVNNSYLKKEFYKILGKYDGGYILCNGIGSFIIVVKLSGCNETDSSLKNITEELISCISINIDVILRFGGVYNEIHKAYLSYRESLLLLRVENQMKKPGKTEGVDSSFLASRILVEIKTNPHEYSILIRQAVDYIIKNYRKSIKIDDIAKSIYVHSNYLSDLFKKETGENVSDFITECRIEEAKELLLKLENKVYMVAEKTGFNDQRYFSQVFKKRTGMTPAEFREKRFIEQG